MSFPIILDENIVDKNNICFFGFTNYLGRNSALGLFVIAFLALGGPSTFRSPMHFKVGVITASGLALGAHLVLSCAVSDDKCKKILYTQIALFTIAVAISLLAFKNRITERQFGVSYLIFVGMATHFSVRLLADKKSERPYRETPLESDLAT